MPLRSFRGALCQELDLGLSGLQVQAVQVLDVLVMLPMHVMGEWHPAQRQWLHLQPLLWGRLCSKNVRCYLPLAETPALATLAEDLCRIVCAVRGGERRHSIGHADGFKREPFLGPLDGANKATEGPESVIERLNWDRNRLWQGQGARPEAGTLVTGGQTESSPASHQHL